MRSMEALEHLDDLSHLGSFSSSALTLFDSPLASANASAAIVRMNRDWICIVPLYPKSMPSLPKPNESGSRKEHSVRE